MILSGALGALRRGGWLDTVFGGLAKGAAWLTLLLLASILISLLVGAWPAIERYGLGFLASPVWDPVQENFGGLVMIYGTLATSAIALLIAVPVSFGIAVFLTEMCPAWLRRPLGMAIELLAAIPSIVYGMWGLLVFGPILAQYVQMPLQSLLNGVPVLGALVSGPPVGLGLLSAGIILGHHDHSLHCRGDARCVRGHSAHAQGVGLWPGLHHLGGGLQSGPALYQDRRHRGHHAGPGPGPG